MLIKFDLRTVLAKSASMMQVVNNLPKYKGQSYLLNYAALKTMYKYHHSSDVLNYIILASFRDYNYSISSDDYTLDWNLTSFSKEQINLNKLLWHENSKIFFIFEEERASTLRKRNKNGN